MSIGPGAAMTKSVRNNSGQLGKRKSVKELNRYYKSSGKINESTTFSKEEMNAFKTTLKMKRKKEIIYYSFIFGLVFIIIGLLFYAILGVCKLNSVR